MSLNRVVSILAVIGLLAVFLHPNPYGNQTDVVNDENYYQTSVFLSFAHHTLPGLDFSGGGTYYGGLITYALFVVMLPVMAGIVLFDGSFGSAQAYVALHTGDLLHLTRLLTGLGVVAAAAFMIGWARRKGDADDHRAVWILLGLLFSNALFVTVAETGKVWTWHMLIEAVLAVLVVVQERGVRRGQPSLPTPRYVEALVWLALAALIQNPFGLFAFLWIAYAFWLGHFKMKDAVAFVRQRWWAVLVALGLQASFFWRLHKTAERIARPGNPLETAFVHPDGSLDLATQASWPIETLHKIDPLLWVAFGAAVLAALWTLRSKNADKKLTIMLIIHPFLTYVCYHLVLRLGNAGRYLLPLATACAITAAFLPKPKILARTMMAASWLMAIVVLGKAAWLGWQPSSERQIVGFFRSIDKTVVIVNENTRLEFPPNAASLDAAAERGRLPERLNVLRAHKEELARFESFPHLVVASEEEAERLRPDAERWIVRAGCADMCRADETNCLAFNQKACRIDWDYPHEGSSLAGLLNSRALGYPYSARKR